jgi:hypothetical protein
MERGEMATNDGDRDGSERSVPSDPPRRPPPLDRQDLEELLERTLTFREPDGPEDREPFLQVARRHRGEPFNVDPIGTDLVRAVLEASVLPPGTTAEASQAMCREIAGTLSADPQTSERLLAFWARLSEASG